MEFTTEELKNEEWRDIVGYEGLYQVSDLGRVKSFHSKERILKPQMDSRGYFHVCLNKNGSTTRTIHQLVAEAFHNFTQSGCNLHVDHIFPNKKNNRANNLQVLTVREHVTKTYSEKELTSKYVGVSFAVNYNKWRAEIRVNGRNGKHINIGYFDTEKEASAAYQAALKCVNDGRVEDIVIKRAKSSSKYKWVSFIKRDKVWAAIPYVNKKPKLIGRFKTEEEAYNAVKKYY